MKILHYGLQRSGTNFFETLLTMNYRVQFLNRNEDRGSPLQKHCRIYQDKKLIPEPKYHNQIHVETFGQFQSLFETLPDYFVVVSKDPYSWNLSYQNWAEKCCWPSVAHHYIEEYNSFYKTFMDFSYQTENLVFIRYVDLIQSPSATLSKLETRMGLSRKLLSRLKMRMPEQVAQSDVFSRKRRAYYLNEKYMAQYNKGEIRALNGLLDHQVVSFLGYELHDPI